ncbi:MAG: ATP-binding cassette domain-containing protein [Rhodanobacteraceae bacterium]
MSILEVSAISKRFGGLQAVRELSFAVEPGEILGLIGPNGSGKSTALSLVMGVLRPDSGSVKLANEEIAGRKPHVVAKKGLAMLFQHSRPLRRQTVLENIELALLPDTIFQLFKKREVTERAIAAARRVGIADVLQRYPGELPFASVRRMELAKALASGPVVVLLDEPFAGLAPRETREFAELATALREQGCAVVLVDHNVKAVAGLVDRIIAMNAGRKIAEGTPAEVVRDAKVREVYFGRAEEAGSTSPSTRPETTDRAPLLSVDVASVRYGQAEALRQIKFDVNDGEFVAVVGINGAGKSTLFKSILGFVGYEGDIHWNGRSLRGWKPAAVAAAGIALCPETRELFGAMSVQENLMVGGHRLGRDAMRQQLDQVYALFPRLAERRRQPARTLSGGEQQMLTIARALMQRPKLLILDEPTLGLAPLIIQTISETLQTLQKELGMTVLLGEQNLTFALRHAQRIHLLETGNMRWHGDAAHFTEEVGQTVL